MKKKLILPFLSISLCILAYTAPAQKLDVGKRDAIKTIAFGSCYGNNLMPILPNMSFNTTAHEGALFDLVEKIVVDKLSASGFNLVPLDQSKPAFTGMLNYGTALNEIQGKPKATQEDIDKMNKTMAQLQALQDALNKNKAVKSQGLTTGNGNKTASTHTAIPIAPMVDPKGNQTGTWNPKTFAQYSPTYLKIGGKLAKSAGADSYLLVETDAAFQDPRTKENETSMLEVASAKDIKNSKEGLQARAILNLLICDMDGNIIFNDRVFGSSKGLLQLTIKNNYPVIDEQTISQATPLLNEAFQDAVDKAFQHLTGK